MHVRISEPKGLYIGDVLANLSSDCSGEPRSAAEVLSVRVIEQLINKTATLK